MRSKHSVPLKPDLHAVAAMTLPCQQRAKHSLHLPIEAPTISNKLLTPSSFSHGTSSWLGNSEYFLTSADTQVQRTTTKHDCTCAHSTRLTLIAFNNNSPCMLGRCGRDVQKHHGSVKSCTLASCSNDSLERWMHVHRG